MPPTTIRHLLATAALAGASAVALVPAQAQSGTASVNAQAEIFRAGGNTVPNSDGISPFQIALASGTGRVLRVSSATGLLGCANNTGYNADGVDANGQPCVSSATQINSAGRISGISLLGDGGATPNGRSLSLVGVFLGSSLPGSAPAALVYGSGAGQLSYASTAYPAFALGQTFYIGDGLTGIGAGTQQAFAVPDGAAFLYLGFADAFNFTGDPGSYSDNSGSLSVTYAIGGAASTVPEPSTWALSGVGLAGLAGLAARRRRTLG